MGFPFRFYGAHPADWEPGAPAYVVTFASPPDATLRARLEASFADAIRVAGITAGERWRWDQGSALLVLDERVPDWGQFFDDLQLLLRGIHVIAPIAQVIFLAALFTGDDDDDSDDEWGSWSLGQARATPGPRFGFESVFD